ncbi:Rhs family protein [Hydrogenimonas sp.]|nr:Rhs family protein [Hydrogenimonas sp.]
MEPTNGILHEDIEITGTDYTLHYSSNRTDSNATLFKNWDIDIHHAYKNGYLLLGSGERINLASVGYVDEANRTVVPYSSQKFIFDTDGRHIETVDTLTGKSIYLFNYDANGTLSSITDAYSDTTTFRKDGNGTIITAPNGQTTRVIKESTGNLSSIVFEDGSAYRFIYDGSGRLVEKIDPEGNRFEYIYGDDGRIEKTVDPENASWLFSSNRDADGVETVVTRAAGDIVKYIDRYLQNDSLTSETVYPDGHRFTRSVSLDGSRIETGSCGMHRLFLYETRNGTLQKDPVTGAPLLSLERIQTPSGLQKETLYATEYGKDANGTLTNIRKTETVNGKSYIYERDLTEHNATFTTPEGRVTKLFYTQDGRRIERIEASGTTYPQLFTYDDKGRLIKQTMSYRSYGYSYDEAGNLSETIDPLGRVTRYTYDLLGRVTSVVTPLGKEVRFAYTPNGNMRVLTTPKGADHAFAYNGVNRKISYKTPIDATTSYHYDPQRRLTEIVRPSGESIKYLYSGGRLDTVKTADGDTKYEYSCGNLPSKISRSDETVRYEYDGTLITKVIFEGILDKEIAYTYNNDLLPSSMEYAGKKQEYEYDNDGLLSRVNTLAITREFNFREVTHYEEEGYSRYKMLNGFFEPAFSISDDYVYGLMRDKDGRIVIKIEYTNNRLYSIRYEYDRDGRLVKVYRNGTLSESYTYDADGNRIEATVNNKTYTAHSAPDDRLEVYGDNTYRYDEDGYLTEKNTPEGAVTYGYNILGALTEVKLPDGTDIHYLQNALNQRVAKEVNGTVTEKYLWRDLTTLLALYDGNGNLLQRYEYADERVPYAMTMNGKRYHLHYDHLGSLRTVTDENHNVVKEIVYDAYGNITEDTNESLKIPFGFAGGLQDRETGLVHFGFREYDPFTGRWTAKDPIGFGGGDVNLYGYVLNDPVNLVDPLGLWDPASEVSPYFTGAITDDAIELWNESRGNYGAISGPGLSGAGPFGPICGSGPGASWIPDITPNACLKHDICYEKCANSCGGESCKIQCDLNLWDDNPLYGSATYWFGGSVYFPLEKQCGCQ